jgi:hypothetical protein
MDLEEWRVSKQLNEGGREAALDATGFMSCGVFNFFLNSRGQNARLAFNWLAGSARFVFVH